MSRKFNENGPENIKLLKASADIENDGLREFGNLSISIEKQHVR